MNDFIENIRAKLLAKYSPKTHNKIANVIMVIPVLIYTMHILQKPLGFDWPLSIGCFAVCTLGAVYQALFVRCPVCGDKLKGKTTKMMDNCPNCNHDLGKIPD